MPRITAPACFRGAAAQQAHSLLQKADMVAKQEAQFQQVVRTVKEVVLRVVGGDTGSLYNLRNQLTQLSPKMGLPCRSMNVLIQTVQTLMPRATPKQVAQVVKELIKTQPGNWNVLYKQIDQKYGIGFWNNHGRQVGLAVGACLVAGSVYALWGNTMKLNVEVSLSQNASCNPPSCSFSEEEKIALEQNARFWKKAFWLLLL